MQLHHPARGEKGKGDGWKGGRGGVGKKPTKGKLKKDAIVRGRRK